MPDPPVLRSENGTIKGIDVRNRPDVKAWLRPKFGTQLCCPRMKNARPEFVAQCWEADLLGVLFFADCQKFSRLLL
jgi:hypothetical protein